MDRADGPPPGAPHAAGPHLPRAGATISPQQAVYESPFVPGDLVGLPMGTVTGPHLLVMPFGQVPGLGPDQSHGPTRVVAASLAGPSGLVEVRSVDQSTVGPRGNLGAYLQGAILIPVTPLAPASTYRARVALLSRGMHPLDVSWTFRTAGHADALPIRPRVQVTGVMRTPSQVRVTPTGGEAAGRFARISTLRLGRTCAFCPVAPVGDPLVRRATLRDTQTIMLPRVRHGHRLVVIARGFRAAGVRDPRVRLTKVIR